MQRLILTLYFIYYFNDNVLLYINTDKSNYGTEINHMVPDPSCSAATTGTRDYQNASSPTQICNDSEKNKSELLYFHYLIFVNL